MKGQFMRKGKEVSGIKRNTKPTVKMFLTIFFIFFIANLFISVVMAAASGGDSWKMMLFHSGQYTDLYMDFFNSIRDGGSENVYSERNNIYPPLCVLIFRFLSKFISPNLVSTSFNRRTTLQADQLCMMIYTLFAIVCILSMLRLIESYVNIKNDGKFKMQASIFSFLMIVSYPVMFCLERGNILILSVVCAMFFMFFKDSENPLVRELSYISLAVSAGIKLYPAIFGLTLVAEKKYKEALRLMVYGVIVVVFPIIFFLEEFKSTTAAISYGLLPLLDMNHLAASDGSSASLLMKILKNLFTFTLNKKSSLNFSSVSIQNFVFMVAGNGAFSAKIVCAVTEVIALIVLFLSKKAWHRAFLLAYLMLNIPSASNSYALSFLLIPFCIFLFGTEKYSKTDWFYFVAFTLLLTPLPTYWYYHPDAVMELSQKLGLYYNTQLNQDIATFVFQLLFFLVIIDVLCTVYKKLGKKKESSETSTDTDLSGEDIPA